jgi:enoyl-[acyl-carrier protein] reductase I
MSYLAYELCPRGIRVQAISPSPLKTRAAVRLKDFEFLSSDDAQKASLGELVDIMEFCFACAHLAAPLARRITGVVVCVDGGANLIAWARGGHGHGHGRLLIALAKRKKVH